MTYGIGNTDRILAEEEIYRIVSRGIPMEFYAGRRILVLTPDATRTSPLAEMIGIVNAVMGQKSIKLDFMVALGTHSPLTTAQILELYGISKEQRRTQLGKSDFYNHRWDLPDTFVQIGELSRKEICDLSENRLDESVPIVINKKIFDYDGIIVLGPVFPHEVVGYSGGGKYFFPGISGGDFLHFFHWLGALVTCAGTIGIKETPMRKAIDLAMEKISVPIKSLAMVVASKHKLHGLYAGNIHTAWSQAADLSACCHVVTKKRQYTTVLGCAPSMYTELWTAGKVMYKLEQVVAPGGRLIIYGPHIQRVSRTWGKMIEEIGYHVRDYFLFQMDKFAHIPRAVLAHSTHVRGGGTYINGREEGRIEVILATAIAEETCRRINLGYMDPQKIDLKAYQNREAEGILFVDQAGEILHVP